MFKPKSFLSKCIVDGLYVRLPSEQLTKTEYSKVKKLLLDIGGKWKGGKLQAFLFETNPSQLLADIASGKRRNLKQEFQFFATPEWLCEDMVWRACIDSGDNVLEPSCGDGAIIRAINATHHIPDCFELMEQNRAKLERSDLKYNLLGGDFLSNDGRKYDCIIANPPFTKGLDIEHIYAMHKLLTFHGRLVTLASASYLWLEDSRSKDFREWLDSEGAEVERLGKGVFQESGTGVEVVMIVIKKNKYKSDPNNNILN